MGSVAGEGQGMLKAHAAPPPCPRSPLWVRLPNVTGDATLLALLTETPQSGEALGARLGLGRVSVHERARILQEQGYPVTVTRRGYALAPGTPSEAVLAPRGALGRAYRYLGTVTSTQDEARRWLHDPQDPAPHGAVVLAERQTAGRGRRGRVWRSGGLTFSVALRTPTALPDLALLPLAAGVALHEACGVGGLKWPNDLLAPDGRKLAGLLLEADVRGEELRGAVLGIGLNVDGAPEGAAGLAEFRPASRVDVLRDVLAALEVWLTAPPEAVLTAWRAASVTLGRAVRVATPGGDVTGTALDLAPDGALLVGTDTGTVRVGAGDVELIGSLSPQED